MYSAELEIQVTKDLGMLIYIDIDYTIEHHSIGWYEYGGARYFDSGSNELEIDNYTLSKTLNYEFDEKEQHFVDSNNLIEWLEENDPNQYEKLIEKIFEYEAEKNY